MIGQTLGHYRILEKIGAGGMGEVYRASDTRLGRDVALKFLPEDFARDPERLARFEREARLLASLNHPHIAAIHGLEEGEGTRFLVLELVEGPTLAERLAAGALAVEEALTVAGQVAEALEAAHEKGIIHRDLKPGNVKVSPTGTVKVLDFGLAKAVEGEPAADLSKSPTISEVASRTGVILGTAAYMSPEQARGKPLDKRTDIWSFGCLLYEALSGRRAFRGETISDTIAKIIEREPDWQALPADTPASIRRLLRRCLEKNPKRRLRDISEALVLIEEADEQPAEIREPATPSVPAWKQALPWCIVFLLVVVLGILGWAWFRADGRRPHPVVRFSAAPPANTEFADPLYPLAALSPDGARLVLVASRSGKTQLYLRPLEQTEATAIPGTEGGVNPFFSPDGRWIAFTADRKLKKVPVEGGSPQVICEAEWGGGSWGEDGTIVFTLAYNTGLWRVSAAGGKPEKLTEPDRSQPELAHWWPQILPDGKHVLVTLFSTPIERSRLAVYSLVTGEMKTVLEGGTFGRYAPSGHLLYWHSNSVLAAPFDLGTMKVTGTAVPVIEDVATDYSAGIAQFGFSENGTMAHVRASALATDMELVWVDRKGTARPISPSHRNYLDLRLSPDGQRLAVTIDDGNRDVWVYDLERGAFTRLTFGAASEFNPVWTPDGKRLIYDSEQPVYDLYWKNADGGGREELLLSDENDKFPSSVSPDSKQLVFTLSHPETDGDLWVLPLGEGKTAKAFRQTRFDERHGMLSPNGRWLAYQSNESGRSEVYVQAYPGSGGRWQVSTDGGTEPVWSRDGRELFYRHRNKMMGVGVGGGAEFAAGKPVLLFEGEYLHPLREGLGYDVSPDGRRFVMIRHAGDAPPAQVDVTLNWFEELRRRVSTEE